jgi:hypothetical protein
MMFTKTIVVVLIVAALAGAGWYFRDSPELGAMLGGIKKEMDAIHIDNGERVGKDGKSLSADKKVAAAKAAGNLRKCVAGEKITYTDEACPPGSREQPISSGNVTVVPATRTAPAADGANAANASNAAKAAPDAPQRKAP